MILTILKQKKIIMKDVCLAQIKITQKGKELGDTKHKQDDFFYLLKKCLCLLKIFNNEEYITHLTLTYSVVSFCKIIQRNDLLQKRQSSG